MTTRIYLSTICLLAVAALCTAVYGIQAQSYLKSNSVECLEEGLVDPREFITDGFDNDILWCIECQCTNGVVNCSWANYQCQQVPPTLENQKLYYAMGGNGTLSNDEESSAAAATIFEPTTTTTKRPTTIATTTTTTTTTTSKPPPGSRIYAKLDLHKKWRPAGEKPNYDITDEDLAFLTPETPSTTTSESEFVSSPNSAEKEESKSWLAGNVRYYKNSPEDIVPLSQLDLPSESIAATTTTTTVAPSVTSRLPKIKPRSSQTKRLSATIKTTTSTTTATPPPTPLVRRFGRPEKQLPMEQQSEAAVAIATAPTSFGRIVPLNEQVGYVQASSMRTSEWRVMDVELFLKGCLIVGLAIVFMCVTITMRTVIYCLSELIRNRRAKKAAAIKKDMRTRFDFGLDV